MHAFMGTKRLVRLALRRDRIVLPVTIGLTTLMVGGSAPALVKAYPNYEEQLAYVASSVPSVMGRLFQGTIQGVSLGSILLAETFMFSAVILALMSIFIVSRHTRHNEEIGAGEMIGSAVVGRSAPLSAALIVAIGANFLTALLIFALLAGIPGLDKTGSAFFAMSLGMVGIFFAGLTAITVQLSDYRRGANAMAVGALVAAFMISGIGAVFGEIGPDGLSVSASWLVWLSPFGWASQVLPYYDNNILPLILLLVGFALTSLVGYFLLYKRDIGSSIFESKPGSKRAKQSLLSAGGLARKLQKGSFYGWMAGFIATGALMGVMVNDFRELFEENELFNELITSSGSSDNFTNTVFASMLPMMAAMLSGYVVTALSKMQDEEGMGRIEFLLSTALGKIKWFFSHVSAIVIGIIITLTAMGLTAGIAYIVSSEVKETTLLDVTLSGMANIPAMLVFMSIILLIFAVRGRFVKTFAWFYYAYCALIGSLAGIFSWPDWVSNLSPFNHTPAAPSNNVDVTPLLVMMAISITLVGLASLLFRRRDLNLK